MVEYVDFETESIDLQNKVFKIAHKNKWTVAQLLSFCQWTYAKILLESVNDANTLQDADGILGAFEQSIDVVRKKLQSGLREKFKV